MKSVSLMIVTFLFSFSSFAMSADPTTETIRTPDGLVTTTTKTVDPSPQEVTTASEKDVNAINALAAQAGRFATAYLPTGSKPSLRQLDEAFRMWQVEPDRQFTEQQVIEILGAYLGNQLLLDFEMEWVVVKDQYGTDYAVRAKKYEVLSYPFASVAKRVEKEQYDFLVGVYHAVGNMIATGDMKAR
jgi:Domain of unknown function (DUF3806)